MTRSLGMLLRRGTLAGVTLFGLFAAPCAGAWAQDVVPKSDSADAWAVVDADGTLVRGFRATSSVRIANGIYRVRFLMKEINKCGWIVTLGPGPASVAVQGGHTKTIPVPGLPKNGLDVNVYRANEPGDIHLHRMDRPFHLYVICR